MTHGCHNLKVSHEQAERVACRSLPDYGEYHLRIWLDGTCVLWWLSHRPGLAHPLEVVIVVTKNLIQKDAS